MKKTNLLLGLLIGIMLFTACKSDDDNSEPENQSKFIVNGTEYLTPNGYILSYFEDPFNSSHAIILMNGTILNNEWFGEGCDFSNDLTQGAVFNITSSSITELANGTYEYQLFTSEPSLNETNISTNLVMSENCVTSSSNISEEQIISGNLTIEKNGNRYTLNYTFNTNDFGVVSGNYVGELQLTEDLSD